MSNLEKQPAEVLLDDRPPVSAGFELLEPRDVPLGGLRAMSVRRTLPQRRRSLIGAWCFLDSYGPDDVAVRGGMNVPPHPHTGLQTVSWLFAGEIEHRDSTGAHAFVRPGEMNLMTAGRGIQHSEVSTAATTTLHGAQLWLALPDAARHTAPRFEHYVPQPFLRGGTTISVFLGSFAGGSSPVSTFSPIVGAQLDLPAGETVRLPVDAGFEHGILVDAGALLLNGEPVGKDLLAYLAPGQAELELEALSDTRALLIGGQPLGEKIVMWWNFVGRDHDEIVEFRAEWQDRVERGGVDQDRVSGASVKRFGPIADDAAPIPAPILPNIRLAPRG